MSYRIGRLSELTGFPPVLLRAWETRHGLLEPKRLENGYRVYTDKDLEVLRQVRALLDAGSTIGDVARLGRKKLLASAQNPEIGWAVLEALPCAVIVTDKNGLVQWVNRAVPALCGYELAELKGHTPGRMLQGLETDKKVVAKLRTAIAKRRPISVRMTNYHKSGKPYVADVEIAPIGVGDNHVGFVGMARLVAD